ncbi:hypothetical protein EZV62_008070 [Acer yangbiense]|uniref:Bromo domain-containing protein n=1 Tax=Acer yangbiense TaxID=1000413 RepID=A0A5C7ICQ0_9ROSI|nr:hypothetical protein EZV62_008070 [Acer yangbiense]
MASGLLVGEKDGREKDGKVYGRKNHNISKARGNLATTTDGNNSSHPENIPVASDDDSSIPNRVQPGAQNNRGPTNCNAVPGYVKFDKFVKISFNLKNRDEVRALKRKLASELDQVVSLLKKFEANQMSRTVNKSAMRMNSEVGSVEPANPRGFQGSNVPVNENVSNHGVYAESAGKVKKAPKMNQNCKNLDAVRRKENLSPVESNKKLKSDKMGRGFVMDKDLSRCFKSCGNLLERLIKHKFGWVFNKPVDVKGLGLHDYYTIIKHPMDLGTVKGRLSKKMYKSPNEFAEDVRLTFSNAMLYNPKGQDVHVMAEQLSNVFEDKWRKIEAEFNFSRRLEMGPDSGLPTPTSRKIPIPPAPVHTPASVPPPRPLETRTLERVESMTMPVDPKTKAISLGHQVRTTATKKPNTKDPGLRDMTYEEKQGLSLSLQDLPSDKLENIVQIIKKRNPVLSQEDDEIEVDIDSVDPETLWELDKFVTDYQKSLSKNNKRKAEFALEDSAEADHDDIQDTVRTTAEADLDIQDTVRTTTEADHDIRDTVITTLEDPQDIQDTVRTTVDDDHDMQDTNMEPVITEAPKETDAVEKIVATSSPNRGNNVSESRSSSGSSSDSRSSSSDSDSDGSSACGSDADH